MADWKLSALSDPRRSGVGGLLLVLWMNLTVLQPTTMVLYLASLPGAPITGDIFAVAFINLALTAFGLYTGALVWRLDRRGVRLARVYLGVALASHVLLEIAPAIQYGRSTFWFKTKRALVPILFDLFWLGYLKWSRRVRLTFAPIDE
jgi:hypothetical protein